MNLTWSLILFLALISCSTPEVRTGAESATEVETIEWTSEMLRGYSYELEGRKGFLRLNFPKQGKHVAATIGDLDDAIAGPLWQWRISADGALIIEEYSGSTITQLDLIRFTNDFVNVRIGKKVVRYKRSKNE